MKVLPRFLSLLLATTAFVLSSGGDPAAASRCPSDLITERGACAHRLHQHRLTASQRRARSERARAYERAAGHPRTGARSSIIPKDPSPFPAKYVLPEIERMRIFREGEGNGNKTYTCGPSASRNVLYGLYKHRTGHYKDLGEARIAKWELTNRTGTARANVATGLNNHGPGFVYWATLRPSYTTDYMNRVRASTAGLGHAVIANVDTQYLNYFHGKSLMHFNFVYGYDLTASDGIDRVRVGEEWSRTYRMRNGRTFNPYGKHWEPLRNAFKAVDSMSRHGIVA